MRIVFVYGIFINALSEYKNQHKKHIAFGPTILFRLLLAGPSLFIHALSSWSFYVVVLSGFNVSSFNVSHLLRLLQKINTYTKQEKEVKSRR